MKTRTSQQSDPHGWRQERRDLMAAIAGGAIVGMPLLYTMEVWQHGILLSEWHLLALLAGMLVVNAIFDLFAGFRERYTIGGAIAESVTSVGIGILLAALILAVIGELDTNLSPMRNLGKILIEAAVISVGVSFANLQVRGKSRTGEGEDEGSGSADQGSGNANADNAASSASSLNPEPRTQNPPAPPEQLQLRADLRDLGATVAGAVVFALNIAPTEEVMLIATASGPWRLLLMLITGVVLCYIILFASGFEEHHVHVKSILQHPWAETTMNCALSILVAGALLVLMGQREVLSNFATFASATVTLGIPAMVGGAAGRLIL